MYNFIKSGSIILLLSLLFTALFVTFPSCDNGPTEPEIEPGRRDYVWEVDTLKVPNGEFTSAGGIWGTSPNNIWLTAGEVHQTNIGYFTLMELNGKMLMLGFHYKRHGQFTGLITITFGYVHS